MYGDINYWLLGGGLLIGALFGIAVQRSRFCTVAAIGNFVLLRDYRQLNAMIAAIVIAVIGTHYLEANGLVAIAESNYRTPRLDWVGLVLGGLLFGVGTMLVGGCAGRTLVRAAEGNIGALIVILVFTLSAMTAQYGILEPIRGWLITKTSVELPGQDASVAALLQLPPWLVAGAISLAGLIVIFVFGRRSFSPRLTLAGTLIGGLVVAAWWVTGDLASDEFSETVQTPVSQTFAAPLARTGVYVANNVTVASAFGVFLIGGVVLGAVLSAMLGRTFKWTLPQRSHLGYQLLGGLMMGVGAIFAAGCNIGNGLSGLSTCSVKALIATAAIVLGMRMGLAWLLRIEARAKPLQPAEV